MTDYDIDKVSPRPLLANYDRRDVSPGEWRVIWRDDESCMNMGVIVDGSYDGDSANVDDYYNLPQESVVCVFFHQSEPIIGKHDSEDDLYCLINASADANYIVHCVNNHDPLVEALQYCMGKKSRHRYSVSCFCADCEKTRQTLADAKGETP